MYKNKLRKNSIETNVDGLNVTVINTTNTSIIVIVIVVEIVIIIVIRGKPSFQAIFSMMTLKIQSHETAAAAGNSLLQQWYWVLHWNNNSHLSVCPCQAV